MMIKYMTRPQLEERIQELERQLSQAKNNLRHREGELLNASRENTELMDALDGAFETNRAQMRLLGKQLTQINRYEEKIEKLENQLAPFIAKQAIGKLA